VICADTAWRASRRPHAIVLALAIATIMSLWAAAGASAVTITEFPSASTTGSMPARIAKAADDNLWFTAASADGASVNRVTPSGTVTEYTLIAGTYPSGITAGPDGNMWFVLTNSPAIVRITPAGAMTSFSTGDVTPNGGIAFAPDASVWLTGRMPDGAPAVAKMTIDGLDSDVTAFTDGISANLVWFIALGPDGNMWFTEDSGQIGQIAPDGTVAEFHDNISSDSYPYDIALGPDGNLWFTELFGGRIGRITPAGIVTEFENGIEPSSQPTGIAAGPDGKLWFTKRDPATIASITTSGTVTGYSAGLSAGSEPVAIAAGPGSTLWFADDVGGKVGRVSLLDAPLAIASAATAITTTSATLNGTVNAQGASTTAHFEYGLTADYELGSVGGNQPAEGSSSTPVSAALSGLSPDTEYRFRLVATNSYGTTLSTGSFTTAPLPPKPTVTTSAATAITPTSATLNGTVNARNASTSAHFDYGLSTAYGTSTSTQTVSGNSATPVTANLPGLAPATTYHFRLVATSDNGTNESTGSFTTPAMPPKPTVTASAATAIEPTSATLNGSVNANGFTTIAHFEYGTTIDYGASPSNQVVTGNGSSPLTAALTGLAPATTYHFRLVATSDNGTNESTGSFTTPAVPPKPTVTTSAASALTTGAATLNGTVDAEGATTSAHFEWGVNTDYGTSTPAQEITGDSATAVSAGLSGLTPATTYYFRLVATSANGTTMATGSFATPQVPVAEVPPPAPTPPPPPAVVPPPPPPPATISRTTPPPAVPAAVTADAKSCPLVGTAIIGSDAADVRGGGLSTDLIFGLAGDDTLRGMAGSDCIFGQLGADRLFGGAGADTLHGGDGADNIQGEAGDDTVDGDAGDDVIGGGKGNDSLAGGAGADRLTDAVGTDELDGGAGNDRINSRDESAAGRRASDTVDCGAGRRDVALVDRKDRVSRSCERIVRR
jgi:streptogramin lyase/phosphodiesterase/alkaline phosphatase D-like protein